MSVETPKNQPDNKELRANAVAELKAKRFLDLLEMPLINEKDKKRFYTHSTPWANLLDILREGLISKSFAERIRKENYRTNFSQSDKKIVNFNYSFVKPWERSNPVIIIDPGIKKDYSDGPIGDIGSKFRISYRQILAVVLPESEKEKIDQLDWAVIESAFKSAPEKAVPIFTYGLVDEKVTDPDTGKEAVFTKIKPIKRLYPPLF